mmetsp:Transcript_11735/g.28992  ORF Transcript_11735/g.28992 Transcript_11735/m.28992 type:complete len:207 (-) Transcript_11735:392-1012(-)
MTASRRRSGMRLRRQWCRRDGKWRPPPSPRPRQPRRRRRRWRRRLSCKRSRRTRASSTRFSRTSEVRGKATRAPRRNMEARLRTSMARSTLISLTPSGWILPPREMRKSRCLRVCFRPRCHKAGRSSVILQVVRTITTATARARQHGHVHLDEPHTRVACSLPYIHMQADATRELPLQRRSDSTSSEHEEYSRALERWGCWRGESS